MNKQDKKQELAQPNQIEKRNFKAKFRMDGDDKRTVEGVACRMGVKYSMGWYDEVIEKGAFDGVLSISDIRCLFNHDPNQLLARTKSKTLEVWTEGSDLKYRFNIPNTRDDIKEMLERGDLAESSFQFVIKNQRWEDVERDGEWSYTRYIEKFDIIYDVAPVTFPANPDTSVAKRSLEVHQKTKTPEKRSIPLSILEKELDLI